MRNGNRDQDNVNMFMNTSVLRCVSFNDCIKSVVMIQHSAQFHLGPILTASCGCCSDDASTSLHLTIHHAVTMGSNGHASHAADFLDHGEHRYFFAIIHGP